MDSKYSFLDQEAPPGYVAGIGRGATGFTTQADVGGPKLSAVNGFQADGVEDEEDLDRYNDAEEDGLLRAKNEDDEDDEADRIYEEIEQRMRLRRKRKLDAEDDTTDVAGQTTPISEQFRDLKQALSSVSESEWLNLPDAGDATRKNKRSRQLAQQQQRFYAVPDSVLSGMQQQQQQQPALADDTTDIKSISLAKDKLLELQLGSAVPETSFDSDEYLQSLESTAQMSADNVANVKKARLVLSNLRKNEPRKASGWIASARLEESVKRFDKARAIMDEACALNPSSDELWLENVRLAKPEDKKSIVRQALSYQTNSEKLWTSAYRLETDTLTQRRILRKALESLPTSVSLWQAAVELESEPEDKKKLLSKAVELTSSIELWLKLVDLHADDDIKTAQKALNDARKAHPESLQIWIHAAKLEEKSTENEVKVNKIVAKGVADTPVLTRDEYMQRAAAAELDGFPMTCNGILVAALKKEADDDDDSQKTAKRLLKDASFAHEKQLNVMAKSIYQFVVSKFPENFNAWRQFLEFVKRFEPESLWMYFEQAIDANPKAEIFWLWYAKEYLNLEQIDKSRQILDRAMAVLPGNEEILFAVIKTLRIKGDSQKQVHDFYLKGIEDIRSARTYYKYIHFLRTEESHDLAVEYVQKAIELFPDCFKLYLQASQIFEQRNEFREAKAMLQQGATNCSSSVPIWLALAKLEDSSLRKRAVLDRALAQNPKQGLLWREKFRVDKQSDLKAARTVLAAAMKQCPTSPELWCEHLLNLERKSLQKTSFRDAMQATNDHPLVLNTIGFLLWKDGKIGRCKNFFDKAIELNRDIGDSWAYLYLFLTKHGDPDEVDALIADMDNADPRHGELWCSVTKRLDMTDRPRRQLLDECVKKIK